MEQNTAELESKKYEKLVFIRRKLDKEIGYNYWKKYVASAFWSQISTPINLTITFLTAITTAQAQSDSLIPQSTYAELAIISLVITTLNTFFRPHTQYATNTEYLAKWKDLGIKFEKVFYDKLETETIETFDSKIKSYQDLQEEIDTLRKSEGTDTINFLTDFIFFVCSNLCLRNNIRWLDRDKKAIQDTKKYIKAVRTEKDDKEIEVKVSQERKESIYRIEMAKIKKLEDRKLKELAEKESLEAV